MSSVRLPGVCSSLRPRVSVIVPIYGIERYIGICIESILTQTYDNLEIILVDDGSPDRCGEICDLYAQKDSRIRVIHKANGGLVSARKAGLAASTGEYIGYVDGDDWIGPGFYESLVTLALISDADIVAAGQSRDLFSKSEHFYNSIAPGLYEGEKLLQLKKQMLSFGSFYRPGITTYVWNKLFRREILWDYQMAVDERITIGEDGAVTYPALMACQRVYVADNCAYHYRQREDSMLKKSTSFQKEAQNLRVLYEYLVEFAEKYPEHFQLRRQVVDYLLGICVMRSGGMLPQPDEKGFMPFGRDFQGKKVAIYSAGTFGQQLVNRFRESGYCEVTRWVDDDYWEYRRCCLNVDPVQTVTAGGFDYVLIATVDYRLAEIIRNRLLDLGVSTELILTVQCQKALREKLLQQYLY